MNLLTTHEMSHSTNEIEEVESVSIYQNRPQLIANAIDANESMHVWGRGTGKTTGVLAPRSHRCMSTMPRSAGVNVAESYMQLLDRTLPPMISSWNEMGLKRDIDFWVRKFPPKNMGLNMPYVTPETAEHSIFMRVNKRDISLMRLVSQDRPGSSNGMSIDWLMGDEVKFLNKQRLDSELMPTNRGNERYFSKMHLHHSVMFTTDMPTTSQAKWIHDYGDHVDQEAIDIILLLQNEINIIHVKASARGRYTKSDLATIASYEKELSVIRKDTVYYSEASTYENIDVLGAAYIKKLKRSLPDFLFRTSVGNERPGKAENTFYPDLDDRHFYNAINYGYVDALPETSYGKDALKDCRKDLDLNHAEPIELGIDVGGRINVLAAGQAVGMRLNVINGMDVVQPGRNRMRHLAHSFIQYYKYYFKKEVIVYHDHTHISENPVSDKNPLDEFCDELEANNWTVTRYFIGVTASYRNRYMLWGLLLNGQPQSDQEYYEVKFNKDNTTIMRTAMENTKTLPGGKTGFEKDKRMEKDDKANQQEAPHYSDAADTLVFGMIKRRREGQTISSSILLF